jgi:glyoxylate reductase
LKGEDSLPKPTVYLTRRLPQAIIQMLEAETCLTVHSSSEVPVPRSSLLQGVRGVHGILSMLTDRIDEQVMDAAGPSLQVISNMAVGFDNIDVSAAKSRGVVVTNTPDVLTETTADLAFGLLLATARRIPEADGFVRNGLWQSWSPFLLAGQDVYGTTLGIVGLGRIGEAVARRARGFGMNVLYYSRSQKPEAERNYGCRYTDLPTLLSVSDYVVVVVSLSEETHGMIGERELSYMKPTAVLINVARGPVVDEHALYRALKERRIWAAGLDVFSEEPLSKDHPLTTLDNVVLLPHIGSATVQTRMKMARLAAENLLAVLRREPPLTPV